MTQSRTRIVILLLAATIACGGLLVTSSNAAHRLGVTYDFLAFHSAFKLFANGENPYDSAHLLDIQSTQSLITEYLPAQMWYGPWFFPIMSPVLMFDLQTAGTLWFALNFLFLFGSCVLTWKAFFPNDSNYHYALLSGSFFYPLKELFGWNQMGLLLTFSLSCFLYFNSQKRYYLAGLALAPLAIKVHLFLPGVVGFIVISMVRKSYRSLISASLFFFFLLSIAELYCPGITSNWIVRSENTQLELLAPVVANISRYWFVSETNASPILPLLVIPLAACILIGILLGTKRISSAWNSVAPFLISVSIACAPFANYHDFSPILIVQIALIGSVLTNDSTLYKKWGILVTVLGIQFASLFLRLMDVAPMIRYVWFPWAFLLLSLFTLHSSRDTREHGP